MDTIRKKLSSLKNRLQESDTSATAAVTELETTKKQVAEAEKAVEEEMTKLEALEIQLDAIESKLSTVVNKLLVEEKRLDESDRAKIILAIRLEGDEKLKGELDITLAQIIASNTEMEKKMEEVEKQIEELEGKLDDADKRREKAGLSCMDQEIKVLHIGNNLRTMEIGVEGYNTRDVGCTEKIKLLGEKYASGEERFKKFEAHGLELELQQDTLDKDLETAKKRYEEARRSMEQVLAEISEMNA